MTEREALGLLSGVIAGVIIALGLIFLTGCNTERTLILTGQDSAYPAPNICSQPENQGTYICP